MDIKDIYSMGIVDTGKWMKEVKQMTNTPDIIEQLLSPQQTMLLCGQFQIGKTNELFHLFLSFQHEGCKWHGLIVTPCPVLYLGWEGHPKKISERLEKVKPQYKKTQVCPGYFKMIDHKLPLNTQVGRDEYKKMIESVNPKPTVVLLDPFKRTVLGNYSKPEVAEAWVEGIQQVEMNTGTTIILSHHTNKLVYHRGQPEDTLVADKVKGAGDLLDGVNSAILFGEEKGNRREKQTVRGEEYSKIKWIIFNNVIKVLKAKDAQVELPMLKVSFNRQRLRLAGQEWVVNKDGTISAEDEI